MLAAWLELTRSQTGLVWTVNRQWDFIQVLRRPQLEHTGTILVPLGLK